MFSSSDDLPCDLQKMIIRECPHWSRSHAAWLAYLDKMESKLRSLTFLRSANQTLLKLYEGACQWLSEEWTNDAHLIIFVRRAVLALHSDVATGLNLLSICAMSAKQNTLLVIAVAYYYSTVGHSARAQCLLRTAKKSACTVNYALICRAEEVLASHEDVKQLLGKFYYEPPFTDESLPSMDVGNSTLSASLTGHKVHLSPGRGSEMFPLSRMSCPQTECISGDDASCRFTNTLQGSRRYSTPQEVLASFQFSCQPAELVSHVTQTAEIATTSPTEPLANPKCSANESSITEVPVNTKSSEFQPQLPPHRDLHAVDPGQFHPTRKPLRLIQLETVVEASPAFVGNKNPSYPYRDIQTPLKQPSDTVVTMVLDSLQEPQPHGIQHCSTKNTPNPLCELPPSSNENLNQCIHINRNAYWVIDVIGRGGSSVVYSALDSERNLWAIKDVLIAGTSSVLIDSYLNEIVILSSLKDSGRVIRLHDYERQASHLYLVLELASVDLKSVLLELVESEDQPISRDSLGRLPMLAVSFYWDQMLRCVKVLHDRRIVHLDLKPQNFVLVRGKLKLIDLGISQRLPDDLTCIIPSLQLGTLTFMSPEQLEPPTSPQSSSDNDENKFKVGRKSDIWSLGVILYLMVYQRSPFPQPTVQGRILAIINPSSPIELAPIPNQGLYQALQRCLVRDFRNRASVDELLSINYGS